MTSTAATNLTTAGEARPLITPRGWAWIALLTGLFVILYHNILLRLFWISLEDPDWSHALLVPAIGIYYLFQQRERLMRMTSSVCWWGLPIMLFGMVSYAFWIYPGQNDMFQGYSVIIALFGLVLLILGPRMMTVLWFPIFYLGFGVKVSQKLWEMIALKLQNIASISSTFLMNVIGLGLDLEANVRGNTIDLFHHGMKIDPPMNVAEACSGLRMLMAFLALGVAMAFLMPRAWWQRVIMVVMTLPIAVMVNVGRVTTLGLLHVYAPDYAKGDFHIFVGMLMLIPAAGLFWLLGWCLEKMIIRDENDQVEYQQAAEDHEKAMDVVRAVRNPIYGLYWVIKKLGNDDSGANGSSRRNHLDTGQPVYAVNDETETDGATILKGVLFGGVMTLLACLMYVLVITVVRPDLGVALLGGTETMARTIGAVGLLVCLVLMWIGLRQVWPRLLPSDGRVGPGRKRGVALAMGAGFLVTAMIGQAGIVKANGVVMFKKDVPLRKSLELLEHPTGNWAFVFQDDPLPKDQEDELGTKDYLSRTYQDTTWMRGLRGKTGDLHVAYYTGTVDTVPHVPQQCFKASGLQQVATGTVTLRLSGDGYQQDPTVAGGYRHPVKDTGFGDEARIPSVDIPATWFTFSNPQRKGELLNVAYFFVANGKFLPSPHAVRANGFDLRDKYSYYCKVQVTVGVGDKDQAMERIESLLSEMMPEIMSCLPDWVDVTEGRWPAEEPADAGPGE